MRSALVWFIAPLALASGLAVWPAPAAESNENTKDEAAIKKNAQAFVAAFDKGDAKAVAAFWTPDGDYVDETGRHMKGRDEIEKVFTEFFAENKGLKVRIHTDSLRFVTPNVAVGDGVTSVFEPDGTPPSRARYTVVHVKKDGKWMLSSVRDAPYAPPSNYEHLRDLEWLIGNWVDAKDNGPVGQASFDWSSSQNYIVGSFSAVIKNIEVTGGDERIGWDAAAKQIRSWSFDEDGGFAEGIWTKDGDRWVVKSKRVRPDGKKVVSTNVITRIDADDLTWQSKDRTVDGKPAPDIKAVKMKRVK